MVDAHVSCALCKADRKMVHLVAFCRYLPAEEDLVIGVITDRRGEVGDEALAFVSVTV